MSADSGERGIRGDAIAKIRSRGVIGQRRRVCLLALNAWRLVGKSQGLDHNPNPVSWPGPPSRPAMPHPEAWSSSGETIEFSANKDQHNQQQPTTLTARNATVPFWVTTCSPALYPVCWLLIASCHARRGSSGHSPEFLFLFSLWLPQFLSPHSADAAEDES